MSPLCDSDVFAFLTAGDSWAELDELMESLEQRYVPSIPSAVGKPRPVGDPSGLTDAEIEWLQSGVVIPGIWKEVARKRSERQWARRERPMGSGTFCLSKIVVSNRLQNLNRWRL